MTQLTDSFAHLALVPSEPGGMIIILAMALLYFGFLWRNEDQRMPPEGH